MSRPDDHYETQCCVLKPDGARCLADTHHGWHLCKEHFLAPHDPYRKMVFEIDWQSPVRPL